MFVFATNLYDTPIDKGFGLVAILSGIDNLWISCMALILNIGVLGDAGEGMTLGRIRYTIGHENRVKDRLQRGVKHE